jgi:hypothetical protein
MVLGTKGQIGMWVFDKPNVRMCAGPWHKCVVHKTWGYIFTGVKAQQGRPEHKPNSD